MKRLLVYKKEVCLIFCYLAIPYRASIVFHNTLGVSTREQRPTHFLGTHDHLRTEICERLLEETTSCTATTGHQVVNMSSGVVRLWPLRLLDTATMTSFERQEDSTYNGIREPEYSVLSYTWGRFKVDAESDGSRLNITGVTWAIPAIDKHRAFNAAEFEVVIKQTSIISGNRFLWVDVACIDQENIAIKMEEIGRQAGIFANATHAFVWLWTAAKDKLLESINIMDGAHDIWPKAATAAEYLSSEGPDPIATRSKQDQGECFERDSASLRRIRQSVDTFLSDWWFSSLWTLQEQGLKEDAFILSREGLPIENRDLDSDYYDSDHSNDSSVPGWDMETLYVNISDVTVHLRDTFRLLQLPYLQAIFQDPRLQKTTDYILDLIRQTGYTSIADATNPNSYYVLARNRVASYELDRIYGVMALYNIRVGAAVPGTDVSKNYTLQELEEEFVFALNTKSAILGQMFLHVEEPHHGKTWQMTQKSRVPHSFRYFALQHIHTGPEMEAPSVFDNFEISRGLPGGPAKIRGSIGPFESLIQYWRAIISSKKQLGDHYRIVLQVDDYICKANPSIPYVSPLMSDREGQTRKYVNATIEGLIKTFGSKRLSAIGLGETGIHRRDGGNFESFVMLLLHDELDFTQCRRIGISSAWDLPLRASTRGDGVHPQWVPYEGFIF